MESITVKDSRIYAIVVLYDLQTTFFKNATEGISDEDAHKRLDSKANHVAWLTGSLVQQRFEVASRLGMDKQQKAHDLFKNQKGIQDDVRYPSLQQFKSDWDEITPLLRNALTQADSAILDATFEMMPDFKMTNFDLISFASYREANCIGQIALWRRLLGYEPMKYM